MKQQFIKKTVYLVTLLCILMSNLTIAQNQDNKDRGWTIDRIRDAFKPWATKSVFPLIAHRGYWKGLGLYEGFDSGSVYPENSFVSVLNCHLHNIEAAELDVRLTKDGIPFLLHDSSIGRAMNTDWDPMTQTGYNPEIADLNYSEIPLYFRSWDPILKKKITGSFAYINSDLITTSDLYGSEVIRTGTLADSGHPSCTLRQMLQWHKKYDIRVLLFLEIFDNKHLEAIYKVVKEEGAFNFCVFKLGIGGGPEEGYMEKLKELGLFIAVGSSNGVPIYKPVKRDIDKPFLFTTINYQDSKKMPKKEMEHFRKNRNSYIASGFHLIFQELVAKTDATKNMKDLYGIAEYCYRNNIRVGGYWVIPFATDLIDRKDSSKRIAGLVGKQGGVNIQSLGKPNFTEAGSCCASTEHNGFQLTLKNVMRKFTKRDVGRPNHSGMGASLVTTDDVWEFNNTRKISRKLENLDKFYKP